MKEEDIIKEAQRDIQGFEPLYNKYFDTIFRFVHRKTNEEDEASDLTQRVFWLAMTNIKKYEWRGVPFSAWLYRIAVNETNKFFRNRKVQLLTLEVDKVDRIWSCGEVQSTDEKICLLRRLIDELAELEIRTLELKFFENKNFAEIAFILDEKESTVKMRLYRALDKLKLKFEKIQNSDA